MPLLLLYLLNSLNSYVKNYAHQEVFHAFFQMHLQKSYFFMSANNQPMERCVVIDSPNGTLLPYHVKTHGNYWLGSLIFFHLFRYLPLLVCHNFPFPKTSLYIFLNLIEEINLHSNKCDLINIDWFQTTLYP